MTDKKTTDANAQNDAKKKKALPKAKRIKNTSEMQKPVGGAVCVSNRGAVFPS
jgi:hypothetical protein